MRNEIRTILDAIADSWVPKAVGIVFAVFLALTLAVAITQNAFTWFDAAPPSGIASIDVWKLGMVTGTAGTAAAFLVTLYVADRNYRRGREHIPSLTMELEVVRVPASRSYDAVVVILNAKNTGTGLCQIDEVHWTLQVLSPYSDVRIERMKEGMEQNFDGAPGSEQDLEFPWHKAEEERTPLEIAIEPNQTEQITYDFVIDTEISVIVVSAWVSNASEPKHVEGWYRRAVHTMQEA